jgi:hypothetical protein
MLRGVPEEETPTGARGELMGSGGREVRVAGAPDDQEVGIGWSGVEEGKDRQRRERVVKVSD